MTYSSVVRALDCRSRGQWFDASWGAGYWKGFEDHQIMQMRHPLRYFGTTRVMYRNSGCMTPNCALLGTGKTIICRPFQIGS